jgi:hypothetical protein
MINFPGVDLQQALVIYSELRNRTVLRPGRLPRLDLHLTTASPLSKDEAAYAFTTVLELNDLAVIDDGEHFVHVLPKAQADSVKAKAPHARPEAPLIDPKSIPAVGFLRSYSPAPAGSEMAELARAQHHCADRLLAFYGELVGRKAIPSRDLGDTFVHFSIQTPLNKEELLYAIETTFALNKLSIIAKGDSVRLGALSDAGK